MRKVITVIAVIGAIIVIGVGVGLLAGHGPGGSSSVSQNPPDTGAGTHSPTVVETQPTPQQAASNAMPQPAPLIQTSNVAAVATNLPTAETNNWEDKIDDIVGSDEADTNKVKQLFALFPKLSADGQEEVAQHLSNLVEDENYAQLGDLLKDAKLPEGVLDELLADVLNRPDNVKLWALLDVASNPDHAKRDEARDLLRLYTGEELPDESWNSNAVAPFVDKYLKNNPN